ncbi:MAG: vWA domain-containing protein [Bacteroidota bacterium]
MKDQVHNLIILDESGSMEPIKESIIAGFNEIVQTVKGIQLRFPEQEHYISFVTFNGMGIKVHHLAAPVASLAVIDHTKYHPNESTPLYDTMGFSCLKLKEHLQFQTGYNVLVTILTDGEENASKEFNMLTIKKLVEELQTAGWGFTYIGTDHDVEKAASKLSISNTMKFNKNAAGIQQMFAVEQESRSIYSQKIRDKQDPNKDFYSKPQ